MGNRDKRDDKQKKQKKGTKAPASHVQLAEVLPAPVEIVKRKRKDNFPSDED